MDFHKSTPYPTVYANPKMFKVQVNWVCKNRDG